MAAQKGPALVVKQGDGASPEVFTVVAGIRSKTITQGLEPLDTTTDEDITLDGASQRTFIAGLLNFSISASGVAKTIAASKALVSDGRTGVARNYQVVWPDIGEWEGSFFISNFQVTGDHEGLIEFSCDFSPVSTVEWTPEA